MTNPTTQDKKTYELAKLIYETSQADEQAISAIGAGIIAAKIAQSDWLASCIADAIRHEAKTMSLGDDYYEALAQDHLNTSADYMDGTLG